jgi:hypothetical protein
MENGGRENGPDGDGRRMCVLATVNRPSTAPPPNINMHIHDIQYTPELAYIDRY